METTLTDAELLEGSVSDPSLFAVVYERHGVPVRRYVARRVGVADGDDLAAEVFARAFRARGKFRPEYSSALPWLMGVANNVIADHRRVERRRLATLEQLASDASQQVESRDADLTLETVRALRGLPASHRDALLLLVWGELSRYEVAAALGVPIGTVNSRIARARKRLASDLALTRRASSTDLRVVGDSNA